MFRRCAFAEFPPMLLDTLLIEFRDFTQRDVNIFDTPGILCLQKGFVQDVLCGLEFTHGCDDD
ncbi:MAG: hypothetical protein ABI621_11390 [Chloroflexota bacterium]